MQLRTSPATCAQRFPTRVLVPPLLSPSPPLCSTVHTGRRAKHHLPSIGTAASLLPRLILINQLTWGKKERKGKEKGKNEEKIKNTSLSVAHTLSLTRTHIQALASATRIEFKQTKQNKKKFPAGICWWVVDQLTVLVVCSFIVDCRLCNNSRASS